MRNRYTTPPALPAVADSLLRALEPSMGRFMARRAIDVAAARVGKDRGALDWADLDPLVFHLRRILSGLMGREEAARLPFPRYEEP